MATKKKKITADPPKQALFARIKPDNLAWIDKRAEQEGMKKNDFVDKIIEDARARGL